MKATLELGLSWMDPYIAFLLDGSQSKHEKEAEKVRRTAALFGYLKTKDYTDTRSRDLTCCAYIPAIPLSYWPSFMKGSMAFIRGKDC